MATHLLFHQDVIVAPLGSGSRGNSTFIGDERSGVLVDCGLSARQIQRRLDDLGLGEARIDAVLITHEHSDHVGGARVLEQRLLARQGGPVPFHATRGTAAAIDPRSAPSDVVGVTSGHPFRVGSFLIEPYSVPHDTADPVAYLVCHRGVSVGVVTDLGRPTRLVERQLSRMDIAVVEFNHDVDMLLEGRYPWRLKQRIRGDHGHLSNDQAASLVSGAVSSRLAHLVLAHLSEENNRPARAREAAEAALARAGLAVAGAGSVSGRRVEVSVAAQDEPTGPVRAAATEPPAAAPRRRVAAPLHASSEPERVGGYVQLGLFGI